MNVARPICLVTVLVLIAPLHAQTCSGGVDGGMDATGNVCELQFESVMPKDGRESMQTSRTQDREAGLHATSSADGSSALRCIEFTYAFPAQEGPMQWLAIPPTPSAGQCCAGVPFRDVNARRGLAGSGVRQNNSH